MTEQPASFFLLLAAAARELAGPETFPLPVIFACQAESVLLAPQPAASIMRQRQ